MRKGIILITLALVANIYATTYIVTNGDSIQEVIDSLAVDGDRILVHDYWGEYEGFSYRGKDLVIEGYARPVINGGNSSVVIDMSNIDNPNTNQFASPELKGFKIIGDNAATGVKLTGLSGSASSAFIKNNIIEGLDTAIYVGDNINSVTIEKNTLHSNNIAFYNAETIYPNYGWPDKFESNKVYNNQQGMYLGYLSKTSATRNLFYNNEIGVNLTDDPGHSSQLMWLYSNTITYSHPNNNAVGVYLSDSGVIHINSSIIYGNSVSIEYNSGSIDVEYSNIEGGFAGTGNIDADPLFCSETPYEFYLMEGSPCIDRGDPELTNIEDTRLDMGCYPATTDIKETKGNHWNWVSFPRLNRDGDNPADVVTLFENFLSWPINSLTLQYYGTEYLTYDNQNWHPTSYDVKSSYGYKLYLREEGYHYLPTLSSATRLPADWELDYVLAANDPNWMGYWLPYTQNIEDGFGEFWERVFSIEAEDWYYEHSIYDTPTSSTDNKNLVYGKAYIVTFYEPIANFYWTDTVNIESEPERMESEYFTYTHQPNYEAIDIMDIPDNVVEIGVYEDDVCVGAVVVQDSSEQVLVYSADVNRSQIPFSFEIITENRHSGERIRTYQVLNKETGRYENRVLISGQQKYSVIRFNDLEEQSDIPEAGSVTMLGNYPNPFNPSTTIVFDLATDSAQETEIVIYNMKGQKVRQLIKGELMPGKHQIVWDGRDDSGQQVGSGLYLMQLISGEEEINKKMMMLK